MITVEDCIESLQKAGRMNEGNYTKREYDELGLSPSSSSIQRIVGGWDKAKDIAGVEKVTAHDRIEHEILPKPDDVEIPENTHWESMTSYQRYYYRNREEERARTRKRKEEIWVWFFAEKQKHDCTNCGEDHPATIDFHHLKDKKMPVSEMVSRNHSKENIRKEIEKCEAVCANCHRKLHFEQNPNNTMESDNGSPVV